MASVPPVASSLDAATASSSTTISPTAPVVTEPAATDGSTSSSVTTPPTPNPTGGALVVSVDAGGSAASAGIQVGDVIVAVDDVPVPSMNALVLLVRERKVGGTVHLTVERNGQLIEVQAVLQDRPGS